MSVVLAPGYKLIIMLIVYTILSTYGLFKIKQSQLAVGFDFAFGFAFYLAGFALWMYMLKLFDLSVAFPMAAGALIVATQLVSYAFLNESFTLVKVCGSMLIIAGIFLIHSQA